MEDQYFLLGDSNGDLTLLDTEGGILVSNGNYSVTIPEGQETQQQQQQQQQPPPQPPPQQQQQQQMVYSTQPAVVQQRVVSFPAHPQQVVYAGGGPVQQQMPIVSQQQQQIRIQHQQHQIVSPQQSQQQQLPVFVTSQNQRVRPQYVTTQQKSYIQVQHPNMQIQHQQIIHQQQQQHHHQQQQHHHQQHQQQQHQQHPQQQHPQQQHPQQHPHQQHQQQHPQNHQQHMHQQHHQLQVQQHQMQQQQMQHQQHNIHVQNVPQQIVHQQVQQQQVQQVQQQQVQQVQQQHVHHQQQHQPQHVQAHIPVLQAGQQSTANTITIYDEKITDNKGVVHIMRTPFNIASGSRTPGAPVVVQPQVNQTPVSLHQPQQGSPNIAGMRTPTPGIRTPSPGIRTPNPGIRTPSPHHVIGPRFQRTFIHRPPPPPMVIHNQEEQPSYQEAYLKQIENKMPMQPVQQTKGRGKAAKPSGQQTPAQQRRAVSQQLGNFSQQQLQSKQQIVGMHPGARTIITNPVAVVVPGSASGTEVQQQQPSDIQGLNSSPSKKLSLTEYRSRLQVSKDLKQQQQVSNVVTQAQGRSPNDEMRMVPVSLNPNKGQQYCFLQQSDGKKFLCPVEVKATTGGASTTTPTVSNVKSAQGNAGGNSVFIVKQEEMARSSSSPVQASSTVVTSPMTSPSPSPSKTVTSSSPTSSTPPIQEQTVNSTASTEQNAKDPTDRPRYEPGRVAICTNCGIMSEDFNRCQRCHHRLPQTVRSITSNASSSVSSSKKNAADSPSLTKGVSLSTQLGKQEFYGKTGGGVKKGSERKAVSSPAQKPKGRGRGRGKAYEEPEIVSLSSDEDEDKKPSSSSPSDSSAQSRTTPVIPPEPVSRKEPIITEDMENYEDAPDQEVGGGVRGGGLPENANLSDASLKGPCTSIQCRSVRIGSYKFMPRDRVLLVPQGIQLKVPSITDSSASVTIDIPVHSIVKVLAHFGKSLPVLFLYLKPSLGETIRKTLKMTDRTSYFYDPCSYDEAHKRITILPEKMTDETKLLVKDILSMGGTLSTSKLEELELKEANGILIRSSPTDVQSLVRKPPGSASETKTLIIYPPPPQKGGISITTDDYSCLEEEQFLNDVIIDFYLKWLLQSKLSEIHRIRTHVFSTFFYKRLTSKPKKGRRPHATEDDPKLTAAEKRHARVKSWTKNVDIFEKDFIVIPINEHAHWFLAIICYPGLAGPIRVSDGQPISRAGTDKQKKRRPGRPRNRIEIPIIDDGEWSDRDEAEGDEDELEDEDEDEDGPPSKKSKLAEDPSYEPSDDTTTPSTPTAIRQPCILIFDSLTGANRCRIVATLRDYLLVEHRVRKNSEKVFNRDTMKGASPRVPQQMNYSDCGIYTLQFAESFFEDPLKDYTFPIRTLGDWFPQEIVRGKREAIARLIKSLMEKHNPNHESITLPDIMFYSDDKDESHGAVSSSERKKDEEIPFLERNRDDSKDEGSDSDSQDHQGARVKVKTSKLAASGKAGISTFLKNSPKKDDKGGTNVVHGNTIKVIPKGALTEKSSETIRKSILNLNRGGNATKIFHSVKGSANQTQGKFGNNANKFNFQSDDDIFPVKGKKKKNSKRNANVTGLNLLQSTYKEDHDDDSDSDIGRIVNRNNNTTTVKTLSVSSGPMKVDRIVYKLDKNGVNEQTNQERAIKSNSPNTGNKSKMVNGSFENISRHSVGLPGESTKSLENSQSPNQNVSSKPCYSPSVQMNSMSLNNSQSQNSMESCSPASSPPISSNSCLPVSTTQSSAESDSGVKTVKGPESTSIIDEDTEEVLFIMPGPSSTTNQEIEEEQESKLCKRLLGDTSEKESKSEMEESMNSSSPYFPQKLPITIHQNMEGRVVGRRLVGSSPPRSGSSSPTLPGMKYSERVSSSGRTIAPPKRYLDNEKDELSQKKRRDKPGPIKPRSVR